MEKNIEKPSPEAKALSLYLMAHKKTSPVHKDESRRMNKLWDLVAIERLSKNEYLEEVSRSLKSFGGYLEVVEKTVKYYIEKTGAWKLKGDDKYCLDAQKVADDILKNQS